MRRVEQLDHATLWMLVRAALCRVLLDLRSHELCDPQMTASGWIAHTISMDAGCAPAGAMCALIPGRARDGMPLRRRHDDLHDRQTAANIDLAVPGRKNLI